MEGNSYKIIGKIFRDMREEKGISRKAVSNQLITPRTLANFEQRGEMPGWIVLRALVQRLGKSADYFVTILSKTEYEYLIWRESVMQQIAEGSCENEIWQSDMAKSRTIHEGLQAQFVGFCNKNVEEMEREIARTVAGYPEKLDLDLCISTEEMTYILLCMEIAFEQSKGEEAYLRKLLFYMENKCQEEERVKIYGKAVCLFGDYAGEAQEGEKLFYYGKAIELCRKKNHLNGLSDLLYRYSKEADKLGMKVKAEYQNGIYALHQIKTIFRIEENEFMLGQIQQELYLLHEVLKYHRQERKLSIGEIGENVCSEKTYRALENGKRNANKTTYDALAEFMEIPFGLYGAEIVTDKYSDLQLVAKIQEMQRIHDAVKEELYLKELEESLGEKRKVPQNKQFIDSTRGITLFSERRIEADQYLKRVENELRLTIPDWQVDYGEHFYTKREMLLIYYAAAAYAKMEETDTALFLLRDLWNKIVNSEVEKCYRANETLMILVGLKDILANAGYYEEAKQAVLEGISFCFECNRGDKLDTFVFECGWILEEKKKISECAEYYKCALYISRLFYRKIIPEQIEGYCKEKGYNLSSK